MSLLNRDTIIPPPEKTPFEPYGRVKAHAKFFFRGGIKFFVKGVTYGPFAPHTPGIYLHTPEMTRQDLVLISQLGANVLRLYHVPPRWFLDLCEEYHLQVLITIPWEQHINFLDTSKSRKVIEKKIQNGVRQNSGHPAIFGYMVGNEIPPSTVRWYGLPRVQNFLENLINISKQEDPAALITYANFPSTEYLLPSNIDFHSFNVYLESRSSFEKYLSRLLNLSGDKPLMLGEFGLDSIRNSQEKQAEILSWHIHSVGLMGLAGTILFSWTDDWYTGNYQITEWAFGLVDQDRQAKKSFYAVQDAFLDKADGESGQRAFLESYPKVSVVVCSYNGGSTLQACLQSLSEIDYPDYEIIVVDDGSTDDSQSIISQFPAVKNIRQENMGLSYARNVGYQNSAGEIIAYTDSDCMADKDWLYYLVSRLTSGNFGGVGGPNISPPAQNWVQACVAAAPGSPSHVLVTDTVAEHIPGCNMAFWRWALEAVGGWDIEYRKAGDDVDLCWRLQQAGYEIAFSPSAIVWHHRRFTVKAFFRQQAGYGEAESLLRFKHLIFFTPSGNAKWKGTVYGLPIGPSLIQRPVIYHGLFGMGLFQSIYPSAEPLLVDYFSSLEWVLATVAIGILCIAFPLLSPIPIIMFLATLLAGLLYAIRTKLEAQYDTLMSRMMVWTLAIMQPLIRGWHRHYTWISHKTSPSETISRDDQRMPPAEFNRSNSLAYWSESSVERDQMISQICKILEKENWSYSLDTGWTDWDIQIYGDYWWDLRLRTQTENHGGEKRLTRVQLDPKMTPLTTMSAVLSALFLIVLFFRWDISLIQSAVAATGIAIILIFYAYRIRNRVGKVVVQAAHEAGLIRLKDSAAKNV